MRIVILWMLVAGCGGMEAREEWRGTIETLPSGAVRVLNPAEGIWSPEAGWRLVPEIGIGVAEGADAEMFSDISGFTVGRDGRIYILDREANELRIFGPDGVHLRTIGGSGDGPGEFRGANGLAWLTEDTLVVVDQRGARYTLVTPEGEFVRSVTRQLPFRGWLFRGNLVEGRVYEESSVGNGPEDRRSALFGTPLRSRTDSVAVVDTVPLPEVGGPPVEVYAVRNSSGGMSMTVPFTPTAMYYLDGEGHVWFGHGSALHLFEMTMTGDTLREIVVDAVPAPVTEAEREEWLAGAFVQRFKDMGGDLDLHRIPKTKPLFDGLYRSPEGDLWVSIPVAPEETEFAVLDSVGRFLGRVKASGFRRDGFVPPVVRNGRLYLLGRDSLGVAKLYGFRVER